MNVDRILDTLNRHGVDYLLIGGVNFLLHHKPLLTYDVDVWVEDSDQNLAVLNQALVEMGAEWGPTEKDWKSVPNDPSWLRRQGCFCLTTPHGALDVFREVLGLTGRYPQCKSAARAATTATGISYHGLSDVHMLDCQLALDPAQQNKDRIGTLRRAIANAARQG